VSISSTFYEQLLQAQIPKAQKRQSSFQSFLALLGSVRSKVDEIDPKRYNKNFRCIIPKLIK